MGINLSIVKMPNREEIPSFDFIRYVGDYDFWTASEMKWQHHPSEEVGCDDIRRPCDFDAARSWVREHVCEGNQKRLLDCLAALQSDADLWISCSW